MGKSRTRRLTPGVHRQPSLFLRKSSAAAGITMLSTDRVSLGPPIPITLYQPGSNPKPNPNPNKVTVEAGNGVGLARIQVRFVPTYSDRGLHNRWAARFGVAENSTLGTRRERPIGRSLFSKIPHLHKNPTNERRTRSTTALAKGANALACSIVAPSHIVLNFGVRLHLRRLEAPYRPRVQSGSVACNVRR